MLEFFFETKVIILVGLYILIIFGMIASRAWSRLSKTVGDSYTGRLFECLAPHEHLPPMTFPETEYTFNRRILIDQIRELTFMLEGVEARILLLIFRSNGLFYHILRECRYGSDAQRVNALSVYLDLSVEPNMMEEFQRFLDSQNHELRMMALLVWLNMEPDSLFERLIDYPHPLSERDSANIYCLMNRRGLPLDRAESLLESANPSVARFGRRVLKLIKR